MNYSTYRFTLDIHKTKSQVSIPVLFGDTGIQFYITLTDGGKPYFIEDGCRAVFSAKKPDGTVLFNDCIIEANTRILYQFTEQTTNVEGMMNCELRLYGADGNIITTPCFVVVVDPRVVYDSDLEESKPEATAIDNMMRAEVERAEAEATRVDAENARVEAEESRVGAEAGRVEAEESRGAAEQARVSADEERATTFNARMKEMNDMEENLSTKFDSYINTIDTRHLEAATAAGYSVGYDIGKEQGVEDGKQAEYDAFWDAYQVNGNRRGYNSAFAGVGWGDATFDPKYDIIATGAAQRMFELAYITDVKGALARNGLILDLSGVTNCQAMFANSRAAYLPELDLSGCAALTQLFSYASDLVSLDKLKVNVTGSANGFTGCDNLEHIIFEGVMAGSGLNLQRSTKLDRVSIVSIINSLSPSTTGLTVTLSLIAVKKAFETSDGANDGNTSAEWTTLAATKPNWTISLV